MHSHGNFQKTYIEKLLNS